jgi:hypothetical protein
VANVAEFLCALMSWHGEEFEVSSERARSYGLMGRGAGTS